MTKRSRLSLSAHQANVKKRPDGFRVPPSPTPRPARTIHREEPAKPAAPAPERIESAKVTQQRSPTWLTAVTVTKTLLAVGAAALTILLLKRRFF